MIFSLTTIAALTAFAHAAPSQANDPRNVASQERSSHSVVAARKANYVRNGTAALLHAYEKYNITPTRPMPDSFNSALRKRQDNSASVTNEFSNGGYYTIPVNLGGQTLNLDLDTGSSDLWVFSDLLPVNNQTGHTVYSYGKSTTYVPLPFTWSITYGDGTNASGVVGRETVQIGSTSVTQSIELAQVVSDALVTRTQIDGLLGMAFKSLNTVSPIKQDTFLDNAKESWNEPYFAAYLPRDGNGAFDFGYMDSSKYSGAIAWVDIDNTNGFWEFESTAFRFDNWEFNAGPITGIADTGTTLLLLKDTLVDIYYGRIDGAFYSETAGLYVFPCATDLPAFSFLVGPTAFATVPGSLLNFAPDVYASADGQDMCIGAIQSVGSGDRHIYGDVFMNAYYVVFDANGPQIGFAPSTAVMG